MCLVSEGSDVAFLISVVISLVVNLVFTSTASFVADLFKVREIGNHATTEIARDCSNKQMETIQLTEAMRGAELRESKTSPLWNTRHDERWYWTELNVPDTIKHDVRYAQLQSSRSGIMNKTYLLNHAEASSQFFAFHEDQ